MSPGRLTASCLAVLAAGAAMLGCGSGDPVQVDVPSETVAAINTKLDQIQERVEAGKCTGSNSAESSLESLQSAVDGLEVDQRFIDDMNEMLDNLGTLIDDKCEPDQTTTSTTTDTLPPPTTTPPATDTAPTTTETTTTETTETTTTTDTTATEPPGPPTTPGGGGGDGPGGGVSPGGGKRQSSAKGNRNGNGKPRPGGGVKASKATKQDKESKR